MHPCRTVCPLYVHTSGFTCKVRCSRNCHCYYSHERSLWQPTLHTFSSNDRSACICHPRGLTFMWLGVLRFISPDIKQSSKAHPICSLLIVYFCLYSSFNYISFHELSLLFSVFSLFLQSFFLPYWGGESEEKSV